MENTSLSPKRRPNLIDKLFMHFKSLPISDSFLLKTAILALAISTLWFLISISTDTQVEISSTGGTLIEGIVGTPRFVNPVLAVTRADKDITSLIYGGLLSLGEGGVLVPNIAESITVSDDGLTYNVILKQNVNFHDGKPLTSEDVLFTVGKIQDPALISPLRTSFEDVIVEQINEYELNFILAEAYAPFMESLTFGILPYHIWKDATNEEFPFSQFNSEPIGSGPYKINKIIRNTSGIPKSYILEPNNEYYKENAKIEKLALNFYINEKKMIEAFNAGEIDSMAGISETYLESINLNTETHTILTTPLPRTFAVFFNQNKSVALRDKAARKALNIAIDRDKLIDSVLGGYGLPVTSPIPPGFGINLETATSTSETDIFEEARNVLKDAGWKINEETGIWEKEIDDTITSLELSISTVNNKVFEETAEFLKTEWERLGVSVTIKQFEQSDLTQGVIRPRDYEALLFGTDVGRSLDFYSFWHSSQRNDPGLNVALYANITTDSILSEARTNSNSDEREEALLRFAKEIKNEVPAIFLYTPELLYIFPNSITGATFTGLSEPYERFSSITNWTINTETVWSFFKN